MHSLLLANNNNTAANIATTIQFDEHHISYVIKKKYLKSKINTLFTRSMPKWSYQNGSTSPSTQFQAHSKHNDVFFITLAYNWTTSTPDFFLQFEGYGINKINTGYYHYHKSGLTGMYHSKLDFMRNTQREQHEFGTFVINPYDDKKALVPFQLNLLRVHTQNSPSHEFFTFYETSENGMSYNVAGGGRAVNNRYYGSNRTFSSNAEFIGDDDYSEGIIGIYKFFNPNEYTNTQQSGVQFTW
jgi:hypothetical protein